MEDQMNVRFEQKYLSLSKFQITEQDMRWEGRHRIPTRSILLP
jgi:hypothetical protein